MKRWRHKFTKWLGRACGVVAVMFVLAWIWLRWWTNVAVLSPDCHWLFWARSGTVSVVHVEDMPVHMIVNSTRRSVFIYRGWPDVHHVAGRARGLTQPPPSRFVVEWFSPTAELLDGWDMEERAVSVPLWWVAAPFALLSISAELVVLRQDKRRQRSFCETCNYDRKGLAKGAPCPECGKLP